MFELLTELRRIADAQERMAENTERLLKAIEFIGARAQAEFSRGDDDADDDEPPKAEAPEGG